jgi:hypothetical protein
MLIMLLEINKKIKRIGSLSNKILFMNSIFLILISSFNIKFIDDWISWFVFNLFFMKLSQSHCPNCGFD